MAQRTKVQYKTLYGSSGSQFPDNTNGEITEGRMRSFGEDQADTFMLVDEVIGGATGALLYFCGDADLSSNLFPTTGGTGSSGTIKKGNVFRVSVEGEPGGVFIGVDSEIRAKVDTPGQTLSNWWIRL